ncbi:sensor histidine kinase [Arachidicoccus ginsenosidimutans]|uniref:sensor histidine kinase n=1 Tax=Arachidicoccus sp. BS20 TaxID=1850526 RepID=UPI0018D2C280|nr:histidine kinase [Arachidicoccus sp. BS20]
MIVLYSVSPFFFIKILFDIIRYYSVAFSAKQKAAQLEIDKLNLESDFLKAQLNPHFLFNTLNNLYGLSLRKDENIPNIILHLSAIMRYTLYESGTDKVPLSQEIEFIENYVSLEKIRYNQSKEIYLDIDESGISNQMIAPLLTFIFIENAFKYGLKSASRSFLKIKIYVIDNFFYFSIINDKEPDIANNTNYKFHGLGITNVKKRLELYYHDKYNLSIHNKETYFEVMLQIELA